MIDRETLNAIGMMMEEKLEYKLEKKFEEKLAPIHRDILTLYSMIHGLEEDVSCIGKDVASIRDDLTVVKKQTAYNYDRIVDNYGAIRELQTMMEDRADRPRAVPL